MRIEDTLIEEKNAGKTFTCIDDHGIWDKSSIITMAYSLKIVLENKNISHLDRVVILCENGVSFLVAILGVLLAGAIAVPIDPQMPYELIQYAVNNVKAKVACISGTNSIRKIEDHYKRTDMDGFEFLFEKMGDWQVKSDIHSYLGKYSSENDPAFILFSSGTTGAAKGVVLTHKAILNNVKAIIEYMNPTSNDTFYISKTMAHASTLTGEVVVSLMAGAKLICKNPLVSPKTVLKRIESLKPSIICVNPTILRLILRAKQGKNDLSSIRLLYTSGDVADKKLLLEAQNMFSHSRILNVYGLTEAGPRVTAQRCGDEINYGSVGRPIKGVNVIVRDKNGIVCKPDEIGTIFVKTSSLMLGYWEDYTATNKKIICGELKTDDLGYVDEAGELYVLGRADDMIIRGAHNIDPCRVENIVRKIPGIDNCVIFGIPDELNGKRLVCAFEKEENHAVSKKDIISHCSRFLLPYEIPQELYEWSKIPTTSSGKISRHLAARYYMNM